MCTGVRMYIFNRQVYGNTYCKLFRMFKGPMEIRKDSWPSPRKTRDHKYS